MDIDVKTTENRDTLFNFIRIPDNWKLLKLKHVVKTFIGGGTPNTKDEKNYTTKENGIPWVTISDMTVIRIKNTKKFITEKGIEEKNLRILPKGTILYSIYASLGKVSVLEINATINQAIIGLIIDNNIINTDYLVWWLKFLEPYVPILASSNTQNNLNAEKVKNLPVLLPSSIKQQIKIARHLNSKITIIEDLILKSRNEIDLLEEYKYSLIAEVIMGKNSEQTL